ncbi:MAG: ATP-dependent sacrificial sulfur transferase LarE [Christensenellaceae bacterium]
MTAQQKYSRLVDYLYQYDDVSVAFSGGTDSTLLLFAAAEAHGNKVLALTANTAFFTQEELFCVHDILNELKINDARIPIYVMENETIVKNPKNRCYYCKKMVFERLKEVAKNMGYENLMDGTNMDDLSDFRPGIIAAKELGIISPFVELRYSKNDICEMLKAIGRAYLIKPPNACLATRIAEDEPITVKKLDQIEQAEKVVRWYTKGIVRARMCKNNICIQTEKLCNHDKQEISEKLLKIGLTNITFGNYEKSG